MEIRSGCKHLLTLPDDAGVPVSLREVEGVGIVVAAPNMAPVVIEYSGAIRDLVIGAVPSVSGFGNFKNRNLVLKSLLEG